MTIMFSQNWNIAIDYYTQNYGYYQGFLDSIDENQIRNALVDALNHFHHPVAADLINAANANNPNNIVAVEQGVHQDEDLPTGGFTLHFTARYNQRAYHLYVGQRNDGSTYIRRITWRENGQIVQENYQ